MPQEWKSMYICPIYRKGDKKECKKYRGTSVINLLQEY
jgi:hypothetical protein